MTRKDAFILNFYFFPRSSTAKTIFSYVFLAILLFLGYKSDFSFSAYNVLNIFFSSLIGAGSAVFILWLFNIARLFFTQSAKLDFLDTRTYTITDEGLSENIQDQDSVIDWGNIGEVLINKNYLTVYTCQNTYHVLPKRDFNSNKEFKEFGRQLIERSTQ